MARSPIPGTWLRRLAVVAAVVLGCLAPTCEGGTSIERVVHVEDVSDSLAAQGWPRLAESASARLEVADGVRPARRDDALSTVLAGGRSRLGDGLRAAGALLGDRPGVVRLRTDGRDTEGDALVAADAVFVAGHRIFVEAPFPAPADVAIHSVRVVKAMPNGAIEIDVELTSSVAGRVRVSLFRDGAVRASELSTVTAGLTTRLRLVDPESERVSDAYEVILVPEEGTPDDDRVNDRVRFEVPTDVLRVGVVGEGEGAAIVVGGVRTTFLSLPSQADLRAVDLLVLSNLPWRALRGAAFDAISRFVGEGGSLLVLGGEDAYGLGGVGGTPYEGLLPLRPRRVDGDGVACVLALDCSGSTGESSGALPPAIEDLRRSVRAFVHGLPRRTRVRVLPFSDVADASIPASGPLVSAGETGVSNDTERRAFFDAVDRVMPSGGTNLVRAIEASVRVVAAEAGVRRRRVFLLTDGDPDHPASPSTFAPLRALLDRSGVEFAAIVRGDEAAAVALRVLAAHPTDVVRIDASDRFPDALVEAFDRGSSPDELATGPFVPMATNDDPDRNAAAAPRPTRLHRLDPSSDAVVWARATASDGAALPVAAARRHGAGSVVAFAGGPALEPEPARSAMLRSLHPLFARLAAAADRGLVAQRDGDRLRAEGPVGLGSLSLFVGDERVAAPLLETSNGIYEGTLPSGAALDAPLRAGTPPRALRLPYGPPVEHQGAGLDSTTLRAIAKLGGGRVLFRDEPTPKRLTSTRVDLSPYCFGVAIVLLLVDRARTRARSKGPS